MKIERLKLKNYRRYKDVEIEFPNGLIGIVGRNGVGKSTLLEAMGWCLYGGKVRTNQDEIITTGVNDKCSVLLELIINDTPVKIEREVNKDGIVNVRLFLNNSEKSTVTGSTAVGNYVANKLIKMNSRSFFNSIFAKQKELSVFSNMNVGERKTMIEKLLDISMVDKAHTNIRREKKSKSDNLEYILNQMKQVENIDDLNKELDEKILENNQHKKKYDGIREEITITHKSVQNAEIIFKNYKKKYEDNNKQCILFEKNKAKKQALDVRLNEVKESIQTATAAKQELEDLKPSIKKYYIVSNELKKIVHLHAKRMQLDEKIAELNLCVTEIKNTNKILDNLTKKIHEMKNVTLDINSIKNDLRTMKKKHAKQNNELLIIQNVLDTLKSNSKKERKEQKNLLKLGKESTCPTCKRPLTDHYDRVLQNTQKQIEDNEKKRKENENKKITMDRAIKSLNKKIKSHEKTLNDHDAKELKNNTSKTKFNLYKKHIEKLNTKKINLNKKINHHDGMNYSKTTHNLITEKHKILEEKYERSIEIKNESKQIPALMKKQNHCINELKSINIKINKCEQVIKNIDFDQSKYDDITHKQSDLTKKYQKLKQDKISINADMDIDSQSIKFLQEKISNIKKLQEEYSSINKNVNMLTLLENIIKDFRLDLISRIRPSLSHKTSVLLKTMTRGKYSTLELDSEYNIKITDGDQSFGIDRFSGGEIDLANLCLRIAISEELSERAGNSTGGFIALDEIFGSQDSERKINILEQLLVLSNQFNQILIITHIEDVREKLPFVLFIKEGSNGEIFIEKQGEPNFIVHK
ncbi:MAG: AAA domain containing protein [Cenarchaeum symbiont of Oopsacas minuta]|nr:AAA domain containing protein [Cenarchaeum symbiont of Oopsacas minuta]